jgi:hypothetical protein
MAITTKDRMLGKKKIIRYNDFSFNFPCDNTEARISDKNNVMVGTTTIRKPVFLREIKKTSSFRTSTKFLKPINSIPSPIPDQL